MELFNNKIRKAFTLAEVLITLTIIGTISMMVLPTLQTNVKDKVLKSQSDVAVRNIMEGVAIMTNLDRMGGYADTSEFVQELQKHLHIVKVCGTTLPSDCWSYDSADFGMDEKDPIGRDAEYTTPVSFMTADGTQVLLSYNKKCHRDGHEPRTCFVGAFDVNGTKLPNNWEQDAFLLNTRTYNDYTGPESVDRSTEGRSLVRIDAGDEPGNGDGENPSPASPSETGESWSTTNSWGETSGTAAAPPADPFDEPQLEELPDNSDPGQN